MARDSVFVGIDLGTTNLKAAAFAQTDGRLVASAARRLPTRVDDDGTREQDVQALREALRAVFDELGQALGSLSPMAIEGIGIAAQGGSGTLVERRTGNALTPMVLWNDSRAAALIPELSAARSAEYWDTLYQRRGPAMGLARLLWLKRRYPEHFTEDIVYVGAGEIVYHIMTGIWRQDRCNALQLGCYDVPNDALAGDPLHVVGVDAQTVVPLREGHRTHGLSASGAALLGLRPGIPVAGPYMDHEAGYLSAAHVFDRPLQCSLGTAWVGNFEVPDPASGWSPVQLVIRSPRDPSKRLVIQPLLTGNTSWDWGLDCFAGGHDEKALASTAGLFGERLLPPQAMTCVPWFTQTNPMVDGKLGGGTFAGVGAHTQAQDFLRALATGLCFEFYRVFRDLQRQGAIGGVVLGGGASKGAAFRRVLAALFQPLPVASLRDQDLAGARGALAAFSAELSQSEAVGVMPPDDDTITAIAEHYRHYLAAFRAGYDDHPLSAPYHLR